MSLKLKPFYKEHERQFNLHKNHLRKDQFFSANCNMLNNKYINNKGLFIITREGLYNKVYNIINNYIPVRYTHVHFANVQYFENEYLFMVKINGIGDVTIKAPNCNLAMALASIKFGKIADSYLKIKSAKVYDCESDLKSFIRHSSPFLESNYLVSWG